MIEKPGNYRVVDLTKKIVPGQMGRRWKIRLNRSERTDDYNCDIDIMSHLGTHVEAPYHWGLDWKDVSDLTVNARMTLSGHLNVAVLHQGFAPLPNYTLQDAIPLTGEKLFRKVR